MPGEQTLGFVGLGAMGTPMSRHLAASGYELRVFDPDTARAEALAGPQVTPVGSAAAAAEGVTTLAVMVATPDQLLAALFGPDGAAEGLAPGSRVIVFSTVGPATVQDVAARLAERDVETVDAPVSGGVHRAGDGQLVIMVGGNPEPVQEVLDTLGSDVVLCGSSVGDGQTMKAVNQLLCGVHIAVAAEALAYAEALGLDTAQVHRVLSRGAAQSFMFESRGQRIVDDHPADDVQSALDIFVKDLGLVTEAGNRVGFALPLASTANELYKMGSAMGFGKLDDASIIKVYRSWLRDRAGS